MTFLKRHLILLRHTYRVFSIFLGVVLGCIYSLIVLVACTIKDGMIIGILITMMISIIISIVYETNKQKKYQSFINCIKRINNNNLMFDVTELTTRDKACDRELKHLISNLKSSFKEQVYISQKINEISVQLTSISVKLDSSMDRVASSANLTSTNGGKQFIMLQEIRAKIDQIYETVFNLSSKMDETASYASSTIKSVKNGIKETSEIQDKIINVQELFLNISGQISVLKNYSEEVTNLNSLVSSIAEHTSMLALNASIEAARAGEQGKGFTIVANEVSRLAAETNNVSSRIKEVIMILQNDLLTFAKSIEDGSISVNESYEVILKNINDFNSIQDSLNISMEKINQMSNSIQEVRLSSENIAANVLDITSFSEEITSQMQETAAQVIVQDEECETLKNITGDLTNSADSMLQNVANKVMEGKMLEAVKQLKVDTNNQYYQISNENIDVLIPKLGVDAIYITNNQGIVEYCNAREAIGLDLFKIDPIYQKLRNGNEKYISTPIKRRVEDNKYYKFLSIMEDGIIYQVGLALETITNFK